MQQLVIDALFQRQHQQGPASSQQQQEQQQQQLTPPNRAEGSNTFLNLSLTPSPPMLQPPSIHQQAMPHCSTAQQGFNQPPGAVCSMPQSSRLMHSPAMTLPDGSLPPCSSASAADRAGAQGSAACPTAPACGPCSFQVTQQISPHQQIANQLAQEADSGQQMGDQAVLVTFPVGMGGCKQLALANSHGPPGKIQELRLVTYGKGSKLPRTACGCRLSQLDKCLQRKLVGVCKPVPAFASVHVAVCVCVCMLSTTPTRETVCQLWTHSSTIFHQPHC